MHAEFVEDMQVFQRAWRLMVEVLAITETWPASKLKDQLEDSVESVVSNTAEGFRQRTDRAFARYVVIATSSAEETRVHVSAASVERLVPQKVAARLMGEAREIANMLEALAGYLYRCDRKDRPIRRGPRRETGRRCD